MNVRVESLDWRVGRARDYLALAKPGLSSMVVLTALAGFVIAPHGRLDVFLLAGTALAAGGAAALNMLMEREADGRMRRTQGRPLPAGRLAPAEAAFFGVAASLAGVGCLLAVNPLTGVLGAISIAIYVLAYTPLKSKTSLCTLVGAVPGALPPVMGWTAVTGLLAPEAGALFAIMYAWQLPHFLAIGWMNRDDYARAGYPLGGGTARQAVIQVLALIGVTVLPYALGMGGPVYLAGALALGAALAGVAAACRSARGARRLFIGTILYLPALLGLLAGGA